MSDLAGYPVRVPSVINTYPGAPVFDNSLTSPFESMEGRTPGPLMTSALALFGKESIFDVAANSSNRTYPPISSQICQAGNIPFQRLSGNANWAMFQSMLSFCKNIDSAITESVDGGDGTIETSFYYLAAMFNPSNEWQVGYALPIALYLSTEAWLTQATANAQSGQYTRTIYSSP